MKFGNARTGKLDPGFLTTCCSDICFCSYSLTKAIASIYCEGLALNSTYLKKSCKSATKKAMSTFRYLCYLIQDLLNCDLDSATRFLPFLFQFCLWIMVNICSVAPNLSVIASKNPSHEYRNFFFFTVYLYPAFAGPDWKEANKILWSIGSSYLLKYSYTLNNKSLTFSLLK